ncbi:phosphate import ATP-binding protein pstB [Striga asiatica]|uniref:Phosphate import ATP-binding protein pstB n=1 Tax=Striga asiatica TaxID=4170 RepID=A0A5A7Q2R8_STRAF|nr:phosphate import ATP-binding protein pstB [Striga asiatica]
MLTPGTNVPTATLAVWVPCPYPSTGKGEALPSWNARAPMTLLLHPNLSARSHCPFQLAGGGGMPESLNEGWPGVIPPSINPTMTPLPSSVRGQAPLHWFSPRNPGERVVSGWDVLSGRIEIKPSLSFMSSACSGVSLAEKPLITCLYEWTSASLAPRGRNALCFGNAGRARIHLLHVDNGYGEDEYRARVGKPLRGMQLWNEIKEELDLERPLVEGSTNTNK